MQVKNILILGCGGFIGSHLLDRLLADGSFNIIGWDLSAEKISNHLNKPNFDFRQSDAFSDDGVVELEQAVKDCDVVVSLAAICNPSRYNTEAIATIHSNFTHLSKLAEMCAKHNRWIIHASTSEVYGRTIASYLEGNTYNDPKLYEQIEDETPLIMGPVTNQRWSYACAKQLSERLLYAYHTEEGMPVTMFRPYNFFGPRMDFIPGRNGEGVPRVLACFTTALLDRTPMQLVDGGTARRALLYIDDAVDALFRMIKMPAAAQNQIFNLGSRRNELSIRELAEMMRTAYAEISGDASYHQHPIQEVTGLDFYGKGYEDCDRRVPDTSKARRLLGWEPQVGLQATIHNTIQYFYNEFGPTAVEAAE